MTGLPHSPEAEGALVAKLLVDPSAIPGLVGRLEVSDFHDQTFGKAWGVMVANAGDARRVDATTLKSAGVDLGDPLEFLNRATSAPVEEYARIIRFNASQRRAITSLRTAEKAIHNASDEAGITDVVQDVASTVMAQQRGTGSLIRLSDAVAEYRPAVGGFPWGISVLDNNIQQVEPSQLIILAARPNIGKTALAMEMALTWAEGSSQPVLFASVEMSKRQLLGRLSRRGDGFSGLSSSELFIIDEPRITTGTVRANASRLRLRHGGVKAIVVDYLQLLSDPGEPEVIRVSRISRELKAIAREFACPLLALSQLSRASENRDDTRPRLSDLRDSGAIEQDADIVFGLWRAKKYSEEMELSILKNRDGPAGATLYLKFDLGKVRVTG
jgi:replicative DNA helicase